MKNSFRLERTEQESLFDKGGVVKKKRVRKVLSEERTKIIVWLAQNSVKVSGKRLTEIRKILLREFPCLPSPPTFRKMLTDCNITVRPGGGNQQRLLNLGDDKVCTHIEALRLAYRIGSAGVEASEVLAEVIGCLSELDLLSKPRLDRMADSLYKSYAISASLKRQLAHQPTSPILLKKWEEAGGGSQKPFSVGLTTD